MESRHKGIKSFRSAEKKYFSQLTELILAMQGKLKNCQEEFFAVEDKFQIHLWHFMNNE